MLRVASKLSVRTLVARGAHGARMMSTIPAQPTPSADQKMGSGFLGVSGLVIAAAGGMLVNDGLFPSGHGPHPDDVVESTAASNDSSSGPSYTGLEIALDDEKRMVWKWKDGAESVTQVWTPEGKPGEEVRAPLPQEAVVEEPAVVEEVAEVEVKEDAAESFAAVDGGLAYTRIVDGGKEVTIYNNDGTVVGPYMEPSDGSASSPAVVDTTVHGLKPVSPDEEAAILKALADTKIADRVAELEEAVYSNGHDEGMAGFPHFDDSNTSLCKKHLTPEVYLQLINRSTPSGFSLDNVMQSAVDNQDSGVGVYAGDEASYSVFAPLFDAVIEDYHGGYGPTDTHASDMDATKLHGSVGDSKVISTRIRVGRNIRGFGLSPGISRAERRKVEEIVVAALNKMEGDLKGKYFSLGKMSEADRKQLVADHFLFKKGDRFLQSAGANRDWPESRGIFHNNAKTFLVWINEEDQLRIISMQKGGDAKEVFERLSNGIASIEKELTASGYEFMHNDHLGYIHSCPTNCGTGMRASVHVALPNVSKHPEFKNWCKKLRLQPRGIHGEHSETEGGVYDLSNKERLGKSEVELVQTMIDGVNKLIEAEDLLAAGKPPPAI